MALFLFFVIASSIDKLYKKYQEWLSSNIVGDTSYQLNLTNGEEFEDIGHIIEHLLNDSFRKD